MRYGKVMVLSMVLAAVVAVTGCAPHSTGTTQVGVRTRKLGLFGKKGVEDKIYPPGATYFFAPVINDWNTFDTELQNLDMTAEEGRGDRAGRDELLFKTIDGNDISMNVIISYRVIPEKAPLILQKVAGSDEELKENVVRPIARGLLRDLFGELNTEQFYIAEERNNKALEAKDRINAVLGDYGVNVERVSPGTYSFNKEYEQAIEDKKVAEQQAERFRSATRAAAEEFKTKVEKAKGEVARMKADADGEYQQRVIEADAYFEQRKLEAEGIEARGLAKAQGIRKMNEALAGSGGEAMVKMKIAEALKNKRIVMVPMSGGGLDVRSTDINDLLELYGIKSLAAGQK